mgnify:CR=1 FL=1
MEGISAVGSMSMANMGSPVSMITNNIDTSNVTSVSTCQINNIENKDNSLALGVALLMADDEDDEKNKNLLGALLVANALTNQQVCQTYNSVSSMVSSSSTNAMTSSAVGGTVNITA